MFSRYYYTTLLVILCTFQGFAQSDFLLKFKPILPASSHQIGADFEKMSNGDAAFVDVNGDGHLDFIETGIITLYADGLTNIRNFKTLVYLNDGDHNYNETTNGNLDGFAWAKLLTVDIDLDGDIDLIISGYDNNFDIKAPIYLNDGNGNFTFDQHLPLESNTMGFLDYADIDNDNDIDIIASSPTFSATQTTLLINDGSGGFLIDESADLVQIKQGVSKFYDVNEDGNQDIILLGKNVTNEIIGNIYINDGYGQFTIDETSNIEGFFDPGLTFGDFDNDEDTDIIITGKDSENVKTTKVFFNEGSGIYSIDETKNFFGVRSGEIETLDAENDGDLDIFFVKNNEGFLYLNDGTGLFTESESTEFTSFKDPFIDIADVNGDGSKDIFISGGSLYEYFNILYINDGSGAFSENLISPFQDLSRGDAAITDLDGDGDNDIVISGEGENSDEYTQIYFNDGTGEFEPDSLNSFLGMRVRGEMKLADLDNDGDQDLILAGAYTPNPEWNLQNKIYLNDGNGLFTDHITLTGYVRSSIDIGDVDNDNDIDILITGDRSSAYPVAKLYINDGTANFTENTDVPFIGVEQGTGTFGDVDGDNDIDVLITGNPEPGSFQNTLYLNDGAGNFTLNEDNNLLGIFESTTDFVDVDNDGDLDLFQTGLTIGGSGWNPHTLLYINNGTGIFTESTGSVFVPVGGASVDILDIDNDGDQDIVVTGQSDFYSERSTIIYINDGAGNFTQQPHLGFKAVVYGRLLFEDLDNDDDKDLFIYGNINTGYTGITRMYRNESCLGNLIDTTIVSCDSLMFDGNLLTTSGTYEFAYLNTIGCDSIITVDLTILASSDTSFTITECDSYELNGSVYEESGLYTQILTNSIGCDSVINLDLTILYSSYDTMSIEQCDTVFVNGDVYTSTGVYEQLFTNEVGCDSILILDLTIPQTTYDTLNMEVCGRFELNGYYYNSSGNYTQNLISEDGCDSLLSLNLTVLEPTSEMLEMETCDSYNFNGEILTESCEFTQVFTNSVGCDSTVTLHLTILESTEETININTCDSFSLNGETFNHSGVFEQTLTNAVGCDSTLTINLEMGQTTYEELNIEACESYQLFETVFDESGTFEIITNNSSGCEHITTLNLTILEPTTEVIIESACDMATINGQTYYQAGVYEQHFTNSVGCDSTLLIDLLLFKSTEEEIYTESCESYTLNGETYTTSGKYIQNLINEVGCDSTITLNLEIKDFDMEVVLDDRTFTVSEQNADRYQWINCETNEPILGANERSYKTRVSGEFAVEIIKDGCIDTSACQQIIVTSLAENDFSSSITTYPNPAKEKVNLIFSKTYDTIEITTYSISGKAIFTKKYQGTNKVEVPLERAPKGLLLLSITTSDGNKGVIKVQKE